MVFELFAQPGSRLARTSEDQCPARRLIEPMDDAEENVAGFVVFFLQVCLREAIDRFFRTIEMRRRPTGGLVQPEEVVVLVEDVEEFGEWGHGLVTDCWRCGRVLRWQ